MRQFLSQNRTAIFWIGLVLFLLPISLKRVLDVDIWWHMQIGRTIWETHAAPDFETFYFSPVNAASPDLRYTWLGDLLFYLIHHLAGDTGLQLFALATLLGCCALLWSTTRQRHSPWTLLLLFFFILGTYQLQTIRNALFSLPLFTLTLWTWWRIRVHQRHRLLWVLPPLLTLWSFLHGSYLLGFGALVILIGGDVLDSLRGRNGNRGHLLMPYLLVLGFSFLGISLYNPLTLAMLNRILPGVGWPLLSILLGVALVALLLLEKTDHHWLLKHRLALYTGCLALTTVSSILILYAIFSPYFGGEISMARVDLRSPTQMTALADPGFLGRIKLALNNTVWKTGDIEHSSSDFLSPLEALGEIYIWTSLLLGLIAVIVLARQKNRSMAYIMLMFCVILVGLGYKRAVGYIAIFSAFILLTAPDGLRPRWPPTAKPVQVLCGIGILLVYLQALLPQFHFGLWQNHQYGFGRAPYYSDAVSARVLSDFPGHKVFTNIKNGGFLLYRWYPRKRVFVDGFYSPHRGRTFNDFYKVLLEQDPDLCFKKYQIDLALIQLHDLQWLTLFSKSENWYPRLMDSGMILFQYQPDFEAPVPKPEILFQAEDVWKLPRYYRPFVANRVFEIATSYIIKGRTREARAFVDDNDALLKKMNAFATDDAEDRMRANFFITSSRYGQESSKVVRYDFLYQEAIQNGLQDQMVFFGTKLFEEDSERFDVGLSLARAAISTRNLESAKHYLSLIRAAEPNHPKFWQSYKSTIAEAWVRASELARSQGAPIEVYTFMREGRGVDTNKVSLGHMQRMGLLMYQNLVQEKRNNDGLYLLKIMEGDFPDSGAIQHRLAIHSLQYREGNKTDLEQAEQYALKAIDLMKTSNHPDLGILYYNLATIYSKQGNQEKTQFYKNQALKSGISSGKGSGN